MYRFIIPLETPSKKNSRQFLKNGKNIPSIQYQSWEQEAYYILKTHKERPLDPIDKPVKICMTFTHGDNVRRDSDNQVSSILDLLQEIEILKDDCWQIIRQIEVHNEFEKGKSKVLIEISDY